MGALLSLLFSASRQPAHVEGECRCACDEASETSTDSHITSAKSAAVARDSPT